MCDERTKIKICRKFFSTFLIPSASFLQPSWILTVVVVVVVVVGQTIRPTSSNQLLGQTFRPISSKQLLANYFFIHSTTFRERGKTGEDGEEDRRGSLGTTISTTTTTHHHHYPPTLTDEKVGGGKKGGRSSENSVTLTLPSTHYRPVQDESHVIAYG